MYKILIALALVCLAVRAETATTVDVDGIAVPLRATSVLAEDVLDAGGAGADDGDIAGLGHIWSP